MRKIDNVMRAAGFILLAGVALLWAHGCGPSEGAANAKNSRTATAGKPFADHDVDKWKDIFEADGRDVFVHRQEIIEAIGPKPGMAIADIGSGTGVFTVPLAVKVGTGGKVYAVDIVPEFLEHIRKFSDGNSFVNIETVLCKEDSVELPENSIDLAFICDTYHYFEYPRSTLASIHKALRPGGQMVVIGFVRIEGKSRQWILDNVRCGQDVVTQEITTAGFTKLEDRMFMEENWFMRFKKAD